MKALNQNWFAEGLIDFEYKKYLLLAYLQSIDEQFQKNKLYPPLAELVAHYNSLIHFKYNKENLQNAFPERLNTSDLENFRIAYEKLAKDDTVMKEIEEIVNYSIPAIKSHLQEGREIFEFVEKQLSIFSIGLVPLHPGEGYLLIKDGKNSDTKVYEYTITIFENLDEKYRGINTQFICSYSKSFANTFEAIKIDLIRTIKKLPNPAVYVVETGLTFPVNETLLPVAKRSLVKHIATTTTT